MINSFTFTVQQLFANLNTSAMLTAHPVAILQQSHFNLPQNFTAAPHQIRFGSQTCGKAAQSTRTAAQTYGKVTQSTCTAAQTFGKAAQSTCKAAQTYGKVAQSTCKAAQSACN